MGQDESNWLAIRQPVYLALNALLGASLAEPLLDALCSEEYRAVLGVCGGEGGYGETFSEQLVGIRAGIAGDGLPVEDIEADYTRLFLGPARPLASPLSSAYRRQADGTLFNPTTLVVRSYYRAAGYLPKAYPRVADDHVAIMMKFMAEISAELEGEASESEEFHNKARFQAEFLEKELASWIAKFADAVRPYDRTGLYRATTQFASAFVGDDLKMMKGLAAN